MGGDCGAIGHEGQDNAAGQVEEDGPVDAAAGAGVVIGLDSLPLPIPLADGQGFPAGTRDGWSSQLLVGIGRNDGVNAGRDKKGQDAQGAWHLRQRSSVLAVPTSITKLEEGKKRRERGQRVALASVCPDGDYE